MRVLAAGYCTLDQIGLVERFAERGIATEMPTFSIQGGGTAATAAVALSRWGIELSFVGKVGDDERGDLIIRTVESEGVNTSAMVREAGKVSQLSFVIIETTSGVSHVYYTSGNVSPLRAEEVDDSQVDGADLLLVDGEYPNAQLALMKSAREKGTPVLLEANRNRQVAEECVPHADIVVASERAASSFTGVGDLVGICEAMLEKGPRRVVITMGDEGAVARDRGGEMVRVPVYDVPVVDRTGAGDIFLAAVALGCLKEWDVERLLRFANAAASLSCKGIGARSAIPSQEEIEGLL